MLPTITISRAFGSGGHPIGIRVANILGIPFYDGEAIHRLAIEKGYIPEDPVIPGNENRWLDIAAITGLFFQNPQDDVFEAESKIILECATNGPCVIIGRCANHVLYQANIPALDALVHADMDTRIANLVARNSNLSTVGLAQKIKKKDKQRNTYYKYYTDLSWGDFNNYDVSLNSGTLGEEICVRILVDMARAFDDKSTPSNNAF